MNRIFIEAKKPETSEYCFLTAILKTTFPDKSFEIVCMDGVANLFSQTILNRIHAAMDDGDNVMW